MAVANHKESGGMSLSHAVSIGVGGMIGAGVFSIMGVAGDVAGTAAYVSFGLSGVLAMLCAYSFGRLGARYPSAGGPVEFLVKGLGDNVASGGLNVMLWLGYVLALALYARAFAAYSATFAPDAWIVWLKPLVSVAVTTLFLILNVFGARAVGRVELAIVAAKVLILLGFIAAALPLVQYERLTPMQWPHVSAIGYAAAVVFLAYEGFGLITNAAEDMRQPRTNLPRALLLSVLITAVIYVLVAGAVMGTLSAEEVKQSKEYALAEAVRPSLGAAGFSIIAIAAMFSTASAINATLYGGANVSFMIAQRGGLPAIFRRRVWQNATGGLLLTATLVALLAVLFDLEAIAMVGSAAFLIVYGAVNVSHLRLIHETGAKRWAIALASAGCVLVFALLVLFMVRQRQLALFGLGTLVASSFAGEAAWRFVTKRFLTTREI